ncbi:MAG: ABC transporter [Pseudomonadota bacterium]
MRYQLVLQFPVSDITDFDQLIDLEGQLMVALAGAHLVDGHDFGSGEMNIFIHTDDPTGAFELARSVVPTTLESILTAAFRELSSDDYQIIFPEGKDGAFNVI